VKTAQTKLERYSAEVEKALHRSARRAKVIAAATGTKLVIYEKGQVRRLTPRIKPEFSKMIREIQLELIKSGQGYPFIQIEKSQKIKENSISPRYREMGKAAAEKRAKYGTR